MLPTIAVTNINRIGAQSINVPEIVNIFVSTLLCFLFIYNLRSWLEGELRFCVMLSAGKRSCLLSLPIISEKDYPEQIKLVVLFRLVLLVFAEEMCILETDKMGV